MTHRRRPLAVAAVRYDGDPDAPELSELGHRQPGGPFYVAAGGRFLRVFPGDSILTFEDGRRAVVGPETFAAEYEPIADYSRVLVPDRGPDHSTHG